MVGIYRLGLHLRKAWERIAQKYGRRSIIRGYGEGIVGQFMPAQWNTSTDKVRVMMTMAAGSYMTEG
jgi:hypothetical protein